MKKVFLAMVLLSGLWSYDLPVDNTIPTPPPLIQGEVIGKRLNDGSLIKGSYGNAIVITAEDIKRSNSRTVPEVLTKYTGMTMYSNATGSDLDWMLNWRGFNTGEEVVVVVDGLRINEADQNDVNWSLVPLEDIERIEVLPGAQSAQYGSGAFAGVVNIITKKDVENSLELRSGSYGYGAQILTLGVQRGEFSYRLNYDREANSGYRSHSNYNAQRVSGKLSWAYPTDEFNIYYKSSQAVMNYPALLNEDELQANRAQAVCLADRDLGSTITNLEWIKHWDNDFNFVINAGNRLRLVNFSTDGRPQGVGGFDNAMLANESGRDYLLQIGYQEKLFLGYEYRLTNIDSKTYNYDVLLRRKLDLTANDDATKGEYAPYLMLMDHVGNWHVRYQVREDVVDYVDNDLFNDKLFYKKFQHRTHAGEIGYDLSESLYGYVNYGEAFKAPTFYDLFGTWGGNPELLPELAQTKEAGLKFTNDTINLNWNLFVVNVDDEIVSNALWVQDNLNSTLRQGYTLSAKQKLSDNLTWFGNYTFLKAKVLSGTSSGVDLDGFNVPLVPQDTYVLGLDYQVETTMYSLIHKFIGWQYSDGDVTNTQPIMPAYAVTDLRITQEWSELLTGYIEIKNLFNNMYYSLRRDFGTAYFMPSDPRLINVGLKCRF